LGKRISNLSFSLSGSFLSLSLWELSLTLAALNCLRLCE
jgi:hypothetical protein